MSTSGPSPEIRVEQCVFGYDDGHRLIASSVRLDREAQARLLLYSDLSPGVSMSAEHGYWTGVSLRDAGVYALLCTWPAPEMPRPGCVWTHVLLIPLRELDRIPELSVFRSLMVRPRLNDAFEEYKRPLSVSASGLRTQDVNRDIVDSTDALSVLRGIYGFDESIVQAPQGKLDSAVFAAWSQQWPRLRRSFTFRTAGTPITQRGATATGKLFDLQIMTTSTAERLSLDSAVDAADDRWERPAAEDLCAPSTTGFRNYLWRYGADVRRWREGFRVLSSLYAATPSDNSPADALALVADALPAADDGLLIKQHLISITSDSDSVILKPDALQILEFLVTDRRAKSFPTPAEAIARAVDVTWSMHRHQILQIASRAEEAHLEFSHALISQIAELIAPDSFFAETLSQPVLRPALVRANGLLLGSEAVCQQAPDERASLLDAALDGPHRDALIERLMSYDNIPLASEVLRHSPTTVLLSVVKALDEDVNTSVADAWLALLKEHLDLVIDAKLIQAARSTRGLARLARALGYANARVVAAGPEPWVEALQNATDDVQGTDRQTLLAFLLRLALASPRVGVEPLFEKSFEEVYQVMAGPGLNERASRILSPQLPELFFWQQWDNCRRLRIAIAEAYIDGGLAPSSFARLSRADSVMDELIGQAQTTARGRTFVNLVASARPRSVAEH